MSNVTFNQLPAVVALNGTEVLPVNQATTTKRMTTQQVSDFVESQIAGNFATVDHTHTSLYEPVNANIQQHIASTDNPHGVTADQVVETVAKVLFTPTERTKLAGIAAGAEVNVNTDWNSTSGDSQLLNKPTINVDAGVYTHPTFTDNLNGSCTVGAGEYILYSTSDYTGESKKYSIAGNTFTLVDNSINYIIADYNSGSPIVKVTQDLGLLNDSSNTPIFSVYRIGNNLHNIDWDSLGKGLSNKLNKKDRILHRFQIEKGLTLSESPTRLVTTTAGTVWYGGVSLDLPSAISSTDPTFLWSHSGGSWIYTSVTQYNNTQYDNGTNLVTLTNNRYAVIWVYRGVYTSSNSINMVLGTGDYSLTQAQDSVVPSLPSFVATTNVLVGRIIVQKSASTATQIDIVSSVSFSGSNANNHSDLLGLDYASSGHTGFSPDTHTHTGVYEPANANIQTHISSTSNPHSVTATQVGLGNVTNDAQVKRSEMGAANGVATLGADSKVPTSQLPAAIVGQVIYQGVWDASTNNPTIPAASSSNNGWYYIISVAGSTNIDGITDWKVGDWIISQGTAWKKVDNTDSVSSVFGRTGAITATSGDYTTDQITETATRVFITPAQETIINNTSGTNTGDQDLSGLEPDLGNPSVDGQVLSSTTAGVRSWITPSGTIEGETIIVSDTAPASPATDDLWLDITSTVNYPILAQGNLIEKKTITSDSTSVAFTGLDSTIDGIYTMIVDITGSQTSDLYLYINGDTTATNYYRELVRATGATLGVLNTNEPAVSYIVSGIKTLAVYTISTGAVNVTTGNKNTGADGHIMTGSIWKTTTPSSITQISLVAKTGTAAIGAGSTIALYKQNVSQSLIDSTIKNLDSVSSDYLLKVGETAKKTFASATSVPLHIKTVEGEYEIIITGVSTTNTNNNDITLSPNNTSYANSFSLRNIWVSSGNGHGTEVVSGTNAVFRVGQGLGLRSTLKISTITLNKLLHGIMNTKFSDGTFYTGTQIVTWNDTTTIWSSLGTITFPFAQSGTIIIKRIY